MSEHTPQPHPDPAPPVDPHQVDPTLIDLVAGDPPVPITVWRTARTDADTGHSIGARLAYRLVAAYSRPGDAVIDLTGDHALTAVCTTGARRHHPGWFTDASSLTIGPATPPTRPDPTTRPDDSSGDLPDMSTWFGDDLTDPDLPTSHPGDTALAEATSLVVACWPLDPTDTTNRNRLAWLLTACARLLRPGGCLVLVVTAPHGGVAPEDFTPVTTAAAAVGLGYLQHLVAVAADTDGDTFVYHVTDEELLTLAQQASHPRTVAHLRVHADLLVFSPTTPPSPASQRQRRRKGGDHRG
ncbi:hypothetical protein ACFO0M_17330 [Micromonospora mangrovi]|uniref:Class I SAM-dependent methyltransferase n=2 Tax=Micromonospora TaxID=1873 RepID=A0AAU7MBP6_9ACTN